MSDKYSDGAAIQAVRDWIKGKLAGKQDALVSGINIKNVNNQSLLGGGNIDIEGGGGNVFIATANVTTFAELAQAIDAGKFIGVKVSAGSTWVNACQYVSRAISRIELCFGPHISDNGPITYRYDITDDDTWTRRSPGLQETLVSGYNIKTINGEGILGSGNIDIQGGGSDKLDTNGRNADADYFDILSKHIAFGDDDNKVNISATAELINFGIDNGGDHHASFGLGGGYASINAGEYVAIVAEGGGTVEVSGRDVAIWGLREPEFDSSAAPKRYVDAASETLQRKIDALGEPFRVKNWAGSINVEIPCCTEDLVNTDIPKMTFSISDEEGEQYQIVGMIAYEVFDAASGGNRINCWPVCQFTGNGQKELSVRWMCGGTTRKAAKRINAWVLLKHR